MKSRVLLEVAIGSVDDAVAAQSGGADRLELNSALELGGLTPSLGSLLEVKRAVSVPVMVMIRPRGGDFVYGSRHFQVMLRDVDLAVEHGADGIVFGVLNADAGLDVERCQQILRRIGGRQAVFHRAFDVAADPLTCLDQLIDLGVQRILTSGQQETATKGAGLIAELMRRSAGRIEILPAAGIQPPTVLDLLERTGCTQVHASLRMRTDENPRSAGPRALFQECGTRTDVDAVLAMRKQLDTLH